MLPIAGFDNFAMIRIPILILACLGSAAAPTSVDSAHGSFAAVVNRANPASALRVADLRALYSGSVHRWEDGSEVVLVTGAEESAARRFLLEKVLHVSAADFHRRLASLDSADPRSVILKVLNTDGAACDFVFNVPGAVALVEKAALAEPGCRELKVVDVESGKREPLP